MDQDQYGTPAQLDPAWPTPASQDSARLLEDLTFIAALRHDRDVAPWLVEGPINGESFLLYVEKVLPPALRTDDIVMDNLGSHRGKAVRAAIRAVGAKLFFLPNYSPNLNPIEMFFAKLKHRLRNAERRSSDAIYNGIAAFFLTSHPMNAETSSPTPDIGRDRIIPLWEPTTGMVSFSKASAEDCEGPAVR